MVVKRGCHSAVGHEELWVLWVARTHHVPDTELDECFV